MIQKVLEQALKEAMDDATQKALVEAQILSQGPESIGALAEVDHPYARRHGFPLRPVGIINEQTGAFLRDWKRDKAEVYSETVLGVIKNENPVADYLTQPTGAPKSKMFQRPIDTEVSLKLESFLPAAIEKALSKFEDQDLVINI